MRLIILTRELGGLPPPARPNSGGYLPRSPRKTGDYLCSVPSSLGWRVASLRRRSVADSPPSSELATTPSIPKETLLRHILADHADTSFGRDHGFASNPSVADYRRQVPVAPYERLGPYIDRVRRGDWSALLAEPPLMFALTSGTTAARKFIPVTARYLADYRRGWNLWGLRAYPRPSGFDSAAHRSTGRRIRRVPHRGQHPLREPVRLHNPSSKAHHPLALLRARPNRPHQGCCRSHLRCAQV